MSASNKKKLRNELNAAAMTEKQKQELKEAKTLKAYTLTFAVVMVLVVAIVVGVVVSPLIDGALRRNSHAITVGDHKLTTAELTYFYVDAISEYQNDIYSTYYSTFGSYWSYMLGFDTSEPLDEQIKDKETNETWADYFINEAIENAKGVYALYDSAMADGYKLTDEEQASINSTISMLSLYATYYGYSSTKSYLKATYGNGVTVEGYTDYYTISTIASSYYSAHADSLEYEVSDYRAYEKDKETEYNRYSYIYYYINYTSYRGEGTKDEDGKTTYTDEQNEEARKLALADAEALKAAGITDKDSFDKAVQALAVNKVDESDEDAKVATATEVTDTFIAGVSLPDKTKNWITSTDRKAGDVDFIDVTVVSYDCEEDHEHTDDCKKTETTNGYYVVLFNECDKNEMNLVNVSHILVSFEGGTKDSDGNTTYSATEKETAKTKAEEILKEWKDGEATLDSFKKLAEEKSTDTGSKSNGGVYEDVYPDQMVEAFNDWCFDKIRQEGDTGIVETEYGYHIIYFISHDELTYRDYMIDNEMRAEDTAEWKDELVEKITCTIVNLKRMDYDLVLS